MEQTDNKFNILKQRQLETLQDMNNKLNKYGRCAVIRPVGFGKTYLIAKYIQAKIKNNNFRVLYIYPTKVVSNAIDEYSSDFETGSEEYSDAELKDVFKEFYKAKLIKQNKDSRGFVKMSYMKFGIESTSNSNEKFIRWVAGFDLIVFDEMHIMGAQNVKKGVYRLLNEIKNRKSKPLLVGMTGTPIRPFDTFNVIREFFDGHYTKPYTLDNMIEDKLIKKPIYSYSTYADFNLSDFSTTNYRLVAMEESEANKLANKINRMFNCSEVIRRTMDLVHTKFNVDTDYMKFIAFFTTKVELESGVERLKGYLHDAFPDKTINILKIHSGAYAGNVNKLVNLKKKPNTIDLIASINMLNTGYHVDDITGIIMLRNTKSGIIYSQQIGRVISVSSGVTPVIFDFVQNLKMSPIWVYDNSIIQNAENLSKDELEHKINGMTRLNKADYSKIDNEFELEMGMACSALTDVYLIDNIVQAKEYIRKMEAIPKRILTEAVQLYIDYENEMGIDDLAKYYEIPNIGKQVVIALKKNGYKLWDWDEQWREVYETA